MRTLLLDDPPRRLDHHGERGLVVGTEDRAACVPHDAVLVHDGLEVAGKGHGVEMRTEEDRRALVAPSRNPAEHVSGGRADRGPRVVLVPFQADRGQLAGDPVGDGALLSRRARDRAEVEEQVDDAGRELRLLHGGILRAGAHGAGGAISLRDRFPSTPAPCRLRADSSTGAIAVRTRDPHAPPVCRLVRRSRLAHATALDHQAFLSIVAGGAGRARYAAVARTPERA